MRIAIIGSRGLHRSYGGIEKVLAEICPRLAALGVQVDVYGEARKGVLTPQIPGVRHIDVPAIPGKYTETISRTLFSIFMTYTKRYDVINFVALGPGSLSFMTSIFGRPTVASIHGLDWRRNKWPIFVRFLLRVAERVMLVGASRITVVSDQLRSYFSAEYDVDVDLIPNGVVVTEDVSLPVGAAPVEGKYVLFASRLVQEKGAHELIAAFQNVDTDAALVIAGGARYDLAYVESIKAIDRTGRVKFAGHLEGEALENVFKGAYLYCLPSHIEGLSLSLLEAMGFHKAALVSDIPENVEVVGAAGRTFHVGDTVDLTAQLQYLLDNPDEVARLGQSASERARTLFSWDAVAARYAEVYRAAESRTR